MIDDVVDIAGTMLLIVAPIVLVLIVIVVVVAYPWVVLIPLGIWWVVAKYGAAESPPAKIASASPSSGDSPNAEGESEVTT